MNNKFKILSESIKVVNELFGFKKKIDDPVFGEMYDKGNYKYETVKPLIKTAKIYTNGKPENFYKQYKLVKSKFGKLYNDAVNGMFKYYQSGQREDFKKLSISDIKKFKLTAIVFQTSNPISFILYFDQPEKIDPEHDINCRFDKNGKLLEITN